MADAPTRSRSPRFNQVALSMPADALDEAGRAQIVEFYREVFGWEELPTLTENRKRLVLQAYRYDQFVFLVADDEPMRCPHTDHFGMAVHSVEELDDLEARVKAYRERDDRVDLVEKHVDDHGVLKIWSIYVHHLLPMTIEVQYYELSPEARRMAEDYAQQQAGVAV